MIFSSFYPQRKGFVMSFADELRQLGKKVGGLDEATVDKIKAKMRASASGESGSVSFGVEELGCGRKGSLNRERYALIKNLFESDEYDCRVTTKDHIGYQGPPIRDSYIVFSW